MFFNNFINNIIKSMMAVCAVTSGWSMNGDGLTANLPGGGVSNTTPANGGSPVSVLSPKSDEPETGRKRGHIQTNTYSRELLEEQKVKVAKSMKDGDNDKTPANGYSKNLIKNDACDRSLNDVNSNSYNEIFHIKLGLDAACSICDYSKQSSPTIDKFLTELDSLTLENKGLLLAACDDEYINIFPTLLRCERLNGNLAKFGNLISAIDLTHEQLTSPDNATDNSGTVTTKLEYIVDALNEY